MDEDEVDFDSYEEFIQYLLHSGYVFHEADINHQKRGDPKITDSFVTEDT